VSLPIPNLPVPNLPVPNLDDRTFDELLEEARRRIRQSSPDWEDLSPNDPGMVLVELFAHLTETMIYRLNRVPQKVYVEFLNLIGVQRIPPAAASVTLQFTRRAPLDQAQTLPRGTRVTVAQREGGGDPPIFVTAQPATFAAGEATVEVTAYHAEPVEAELVGVGSGLPGLTVQAKRPPLVSPAHTDLELVVGVETPRADAPGAEPDERVPAREYAGKRYRLWRAVASFSHVGSDPYVYRVDRLTGLIVFAPALRAVDEGGNLAADAQALGAIPPAGSEIRLWYWRGGGDAGNVAAGSLTVLKDALSGISVTNPAAAAGARSAESVENALLRGPQTLHSLQGAITAADFENIAQAGAQGVGRAKAITQAALWQHAQPGTVEVLLVPNLPEAGRTDGAVTLDALRSQETESVRRRIGADLEVRRPLGTTCLVNWARYKPVRVLARIVVRRQENRDAVAARVLARLHGLINPLPTPLHPAGRPFGQALRVSQVYDAALAEPGVQWVDQVRLFVQDVPQTQVATLTADAFQPHTWYAGSGAALFRSLNDGEGWEVAAHFADETIQVVATHPRRAGYVAVVTKPLEGTGARIYLSHNCGESWRATPIATAFPINDLAWTLREGMPWLLLATDVGLYELAVPPVDDARSSGAGPVQVLVESADPDLGFYAVVAAWDVRGEAGVALAAQKTQGVYWSAEGGRRDTFRRIGLQKQDIRTLAVQYDGPRAYLWAGVAAAGPDDGGKGCFRWELLGSQNPAEGWQAFDQGWQGGSCRALAFLRGHVLAATHRSGVLRLDTGAREPAWMGADVRCGLPLRDAGRFHPVDALGVGPGGACVMAGGAEGIFRSLDGGVTYARATRQEFTDRVTLPPTWLFCSDAHEIEVIGEDEAERD
jgi:hypothetical protein